MDKAAPTYNRQGPYISVCGRRNRQEKTGLIINSVPFGHQHSINPTSFTYTPSTGKVAQGTVEFGQLINGFISDKGFTNKENLIRIIHRHQLGKGPHQWLDHPVSQLELV
jgi:hypothetical protein